MSQSTTRRTTHRTAETPGYATSSAGRHPSGSGYLRRGISSGLFAGIAGMVSLVPVRRALREGSSDQALQRAMLAVFWIGTAMTQWGLNRSNRRGS